MTTSRAADGRPSPTPAPCGSTPPRPSASISPPHGAHDASSSAAPGALGSDGRDAPGRSTAPGRLIDVDDPWPPHPSASLCPDPGCSSPHGSTSDDDGEAGEVDDDRDAHAFMLAAALLDERGPVNGWRQAPRREGLACAVIDAVMTPRVTSETVDAVVMRFGMRYGCDADLPTLTRSLDELGRDTWRREIGTNHRTHARHDAPYKADVITEAARVLVPALETTVAVFAVIILLAPVVQTWYALTLVPVAAVLMPKLGRRRLAIVLGALGGFTAIWDATLAGASVLVGGIVAAVWVERQRRGRTVEAADRLVTPDRRGGDDGLSIKG